LALALAQPNGSACSAPRGLARVRMKGYGVQLFDLRFEDDEKKNSARESVS